MSSGLFKNIINNLFVNKSYIYQNKEDFVIKPNQSS